MVFDNPHMELLVALRVTLSLSKQYRDHVEGTMTLSELERALRASITELEIAKPGSEGKGYLDREQTWQMKEQRTAPPVPMSKMYEGM
jgi:hypothetical protein